jgi:hypothetical protein
MRHGHLQFNSKPRAGKQARGASRRARASDILLGLAVMMFIIWLFAFAISQIFAAA